jgi:hypothetical protein
MQAAETETGVSGILCMPDRKLNNEESSTESMGPLFKRGSVIYNFYVTILATRGMEESRGTVYWISL